MSGLWRSCSCGHAGSFWPLLHRTDGFLWACDRKHLWLDVNRVPLALPRSKAVDVAWQIALNLNLSLGGLFRSDSCERFCGWHPGDGQEAAASSLFMALVGSNGYRWGHGEVEAEASKLRVRPSSRCWPAWCADKKWLIFVFCSSGLTTKAVMFFSGMAACSRVPRHRAVHRGSDLRCKHF